MIRTRPPLSIDFDDIVAYFFKHFLPWCACTNGTTLQYEDMHDYGNHSLLHPDEDQVRNWINYYAMHHHMDCSPVEGVIEELHRLHNHFELHVVTSRPESKRPALEHWCQEYDIWDLIADATFTNSFGNDPDAPRTDKPTVCCQLGAVAHIDDAVGHAEAVTNRLGIPVYMLERPWNQGKIPAAARLAHNWQDIGDRLLQQHATF